MTTEPRSRGAARKPGAPPNEEAVAALLAMMGLLATLVGWSLLSRDEPPETATVVEAPDALEPEARDVAPSFPELVGVDTELPPARSRVDVVTRASGRRRR